MPSWPRRRRLNEGSRARHAEDVGDADRRRVWRFFQLDDLIGGRITKTAGSEALIQVEAFDVRIMRVR